MNILLTSVGRRSYLVRYFHDALRGRGKVIGANSDPNTSGMYEVDEAVVVPESHDPAYVDSIENICLQHEVGMLCSFHDLDIYVLSQYRDRLSKLGVIPVLPDSDWGRICLDKYECGLRIQKCGWQVPWTTISLNEAKSALAEGIVRFPLMVKARLGFGSLGLHRCNDLFELDVWHQQVRQELVGSVLQRFVPMPEDDLVLIQEVIEGPEYCVDVVNDLQGRYASHFVCQVHSMRAGESDAVTTVDPGIVGELPRELSRMTKHVGLWGIDLMVHNGVPKVIDVNPRFTGDYPFQQIAGANIPAALIAWSLGQEPDTQWLKPKVGVRGYKDLMPTPAHVLRPVSEEDQANTTETAIQEPKAYSSTNSAKWRVLVVPGGTEIGLELWQSLAWCKEVELFSAGQPDHTHAPYIFKRHFSAPNVSDPGCLAALEKIAAEQGITHIFPAHDDVLMLLVENAARFAAKIVTSSLETCRIARSKTATRLALKDVIPTPKLYASPAEVTTFPVFLKPDRGQGSHGTATARSKEELAALLVQDANRIILEYLPGQEYTVDCFSDREKGLLYAAGRVRRRIRSGIAMNSKLVDNSLFKKYAERIGSVLKFHGAWFYQVREDVEGELKLMEVSVRIGGTSGLSRVRGVNLPLLSLYEADRIPVKIEPMDFDVEIDRALISRFHHNITYKTLYVDFDDTLVIHGRLNVLLVSVLYQSMSRGVRLVLLTRHAHDIGETLRSHRLHELFDEIIQLRANEPKADYIKDGEAIFIDDSFAERKAVHAQTGIPVFDTTMLRMLLDERA